MTSRLFFRILCLTLISAAAEGQVLTPVASIKPTGQYAVGRRAINWTDSSRRDPTDSTQYREVTGWVWYPASGAKDAQELPLPEDWQALRIEALRVKLGSDVAAAMKSFTVHERTDAPISADRSAFPVLLFVPGLSWLASDYSVMIDDLVSHGYVVIGISPTGFSDPVKLPGGRIARRSLGLGEKIGTEQSYAQDDATFALKKIREMNDAGSLSARLDVKHIGMFGHSLGGTTALVVAARDSTVRAAINIDGDPMGDVLAVRPHQPILLVSSESPTIDEAPQNLTQRMDLVKQGIERSEKRRSDDWASIASQSIVAKRITVPGAHHLNFEDAALASGLLTDKAARWMKFGSIEPERGLETLTSIVRTFFDRYLLGS